MHDKGAASGAYFRMPSNTQMRSEANMSYPQPAVHLTGYDRPLVGAVPAYQPVTAMMGGRVETYAPTPGVLFQVWLNSHHSSTRACHVNEHATPGHHRQVGPSPLSSKVFAKLHNIILQLWN
jgi:hypothetical protein